MENEKNDTKKAIKEIVKEKWKRCWPYIKTGGTCLFIGFVYGFITGSEANNDMWLKNGFERTRDDSGDTTDDFVYDESNVDDPELLEMIRDGSIEG